MKTIQTPLVMDQFKCAACGALVWQCRTENNRLEPAIKFIHGCVSGWMTTDICRGVQLTRTGDTHAGWISGADTVPNLPPRKQPRIHDPATKNRNRYSRTPQGLHFDRKEARG